MIYEPELMKTIYSMYCDGMSINDIIYYCLYFTEWHNVKVDDVDEIIDQMNILFA